MHAPGRKSLLLGAVRANAGLRSAYARRLRQLVAIMRKAYEWWTVDRVREADALARGLDRLYDYWAEHFDHYAMRTVEPVLTGMLDDNNTQWHARLRTVGYNIPLHTTDAQRRILKLKVAENVALIRTIHSHYHGQVAGAVLRASIRGRDLDSLTRDIRDIGQTTTSRAAFIAHDQANKLTAQMNSSRQQSLGIEYSVWVHSAAGKEPRRTHVTASRGQWLFRNSDGIDFGDDFGPVLPGEAINCRCIARSVIPAIGRGAPGVLDDLEPVPGYPGAFTARPGLSPGHRPKRDVTETRVPPGSPVKYS